ncbi:MAG: hypothetical protein JWO03_3127 [Bacteroidetes bacterium]|nr:hypothetical protein [Bacteroidota bacterium]
MSYSLEQTQIISEETETNILMDDEGVNIWIDKYSDVFSDFDTRPLFKRKLSNDLIVEICKLVAGNASAKVEINFNILDDNRDIEVENIIVGHLKTHFTNSKKAEKAKVRKTTKLGYMLTSLGFFIILTIAYVSSLAKGVFFLNSLPVVVEPLAWFVTWTGLDHIFKHFGDNKIKDINTRMLESSISFSCMGEVSLHDQSVTTPKARKVIPAGNNLRVA